VTDTGRGMLSHPLKVRLRSLTDQVVGGRLQSSGGTSRTKGILSK
jgi:hypothetical protein